jgi:HEAT repeat protein
MDAHEPSADPRSTQTLIALALRGEADDEQAWEAIRVLQARGTPEVLAEAERLVRCEEPLGRARGAAILGRLDVEDEAAHEARVRLLLELVRREQDTGVLEAALLALSFFDEPRVALALLPLKSHASDDVRLAVARALSARDSQPEMIDALILLSADANRDVRSWATFNLASQESFDSPALRDALLARLGETDLEIQGEAFLGLALRKDSRLFEPLRAALSARTVGALAVEAALELRDARLYPELVALRDREGEADAYFRGVLDGAIRAYETHSEG